MADTAGRVLRGAFDEVMGAIAPPEGILAEGPSNICLYLTEKCDFDGGFLSNFSEKWQG